VLKKETGAQSKSKKCDSALLWFTISLVVSSRSRWRRVVSESVKITKTLVTPPAFCTGVFPAFDQQAQNDRSNFCFRTKRSPTVQSSVRENNNKFVARWRTGQQLLRNSLVVA